jgi:hypothetical protein
MTTETSLAAISIQQSLLSIDEQVDDQDSWVAHTYH